MPTEFRIWNSNSGIQSFNLIKSRETFSKQETRYEAVCAGHARSCVGCLQHSNGHSRAVCGGQKTFRGSENPCIRTRPGFYGCVRCRLCQASGPGCRASRVSPECSTESAV